MIRFNKHVEFNIYSNEVRFQHIGGEQKMEVELIYAGIRSDHYQ